MTIGIAPRIGMIEPSLELPKNRPAAGIPSVRSPF